jgi:hypothetical protein
MSDIGVYVRKEVLEHKKRDGKESDERYCYWTSTTRPNVLDGDRLWFASEGRWQGFFQIRRAFLMLDGEDQNHGHGPSESADPMPDGIDINEVSLHDGMELRWHSESWHSLGNDGGPRKPFQGFTYNVPPKSWVPRER